MTSPIFIDVNIPIYEAGGDHPLKSPCRQVLLLVTANPGAYTTDAEVFQELLHRYHALRMWERGRTVFDGFSRIMQGRVLPIEHRHTEAAARLLSDQPRLQARDALHVAVMQDAGCDRIVTADRAFDAVPGITRLDPLRVAEWSADLTP